MKIEDVNSLPKIRPHKNLCRNELLRSGRCGTRWLDFSHLFLRVFTVKRGRRNKYLPKKINKKKIYKKLDLSQKIITHQEEIIFPCPTLSKAFNIEKIYFTASPYFIEDLEKPKKLTIKLRKKFFFVFIFSFLI